MISSHEAAQTLQAFIRPVLAQKELEPLRILRKDLAHLEDDHEVREGWGEFIVSRFEEGHFSPVDLETYKKIFALFLKYDLVLWATTGDLSLLPQRVELLTEEVEKIDARLRITFIPKVLYELTFLTQSMQWALAKEAAFTYKDPSNPTMQEEGALRNSCDSDKDPWTQNHSRLSIVQNPLQSELFLERVHRLNGILCELLTSSCFTVQKLKTMLETHLHFLKELHLESGSELSKRAKKVLSINHPSMISNFICENTRGSLHPLGVQNEKFANILRKSLLLECLPGRVLLYRGSKYYQDRLYHGMKGACQSLSYGTSLYAGCVTDRTANAFYYMRKEENDAFAIALPTSELRKGVFYIPVQHTLLQMFGHGEEFHSRSKAWKMEDEKGLIAGIDAEGMGHGEVHRGRYWKYLPEFLKSELSQEDFTQEFRKTKRLTVFLKPS